jgi:hypothetical protein
MEMTERTVRRAVSRASLVAAFTLSLPLVMVTQAGALPPYPAVPQNSPRAHTPFTKVLPPEANPGYFIGADTDVRPWHSCDATAFASIPTDDLAEPGIPHDPPDAQEAVEITVNPDGTPYFSWKANPGWVICGTEVTVILYNSTLTSSLLSEVAYPSGAHDGSTSVTGQETITTLIPKDALDEDNYRQFEGKRFDLTQFQNITVFVHKG